MELGLLFIFVIILGIGVFVLWLWSLIDAIQNAENKILWALIIILLGFPIGSFLWWCIGERERKRIVRSRYRRRPLGEQR